MLIFNEKVPIISDTIKRVIVPVIKELGLELVFNEEKKTYQLE
jgi:hypothetical protein